MVFVIDTDKNPLHPCREARARILLRQGKAAVWRMEPFTIILKRSVTEHIQSMRLKLDPGSRHSGAAILSGSRVVWLGCIEHRTDIRKKLEQRRAYRRRRRTANLRYREPRFDNRTRQEGWLPPSFRSRVDNIAYYDQSIATGVTGNNAGGRYYFRIFQNNSFKPTTGAAEEFELISADPFSGGNIATFTPNSTYSSYGSTIGR